MIIATFCTLFTVEKNRGKGILQAMKSNQCQEIGFHIVLVNRTGDVVNHDKILELPKNTSSRSQPIPHLRDHSLRNFLVHCPIYRKFGLPPQEMHHRFHFHQGPSSLSRWDRWLRAPLPPSSTICIGPHGASFTSASPSVDQETVLPHNFSLSTKASWSS